MPSSLLQAEELQPGFSKAGRVYISKVNYLPIFDMMKTGMLILQGTPESIHIHSLLVSGTISPRFSLLSHLSVTEN